jgi:dihydropyrimidinase
VLDFAGAGREPPDEALRAWHARARERVAVDYGFHLTLTSIPDDPLEARRLFESFVRKGVTSVKLYLAYPERLMVDEATLSRALRAGAEANVLVCVHAEDGHEIDRRAGEAIRTGGGVHPEELPATRPPSVEARAIRRAAEIAAEVGAALYIVHLSSRAGLEEAIDARRRGTRIFLETCPQYLVLTDEKLRQPADDAANFVCAPPLRSDRDREALWSSLASGAVAVVATDHCPFTLADRRRGTGGGDHWTNFTEIPGGLPGVETRLSLVYQGVREGRLTLERWADAVAGAPARVFGLSRKKGALRAGLDADVVVFDPGARKRLDAGSLHMRTDHSPYEGMEVEGWPALTVSRGRIVARQGAPGDIQAGWGTFIPRRPFDPDTARNGPERATGP